MSAPIREGSRGPEVLELQWLLRATGHDPGALDGIFGPRTRAAVDAALVAMYGESVANAASIHDSEIDALRALPRVAVEMPRLHTPTTLDDLAQALTFGYVRAFGPACTPDPGRMSAAVRVALAQLAVEHGADYSAIWSNNLGNRQVRRDVDINAWPPYYSLRSREVVRDGQSEYLTAPYYAFPPGPTGLEEGAAAYWTALRDHYPTALTRFESGNPDGAARCLKSFGYYTGDVDAYARAMVDRFARL